MNITGLMRPHIYPKAIPINWRELSNKRFGKGARGEQDLGHSAPLSRVSLPNYRGSDCWPGKKNKTLENLERAAQPSVEHPTPLFSTCHAAYDTAKLTVSNQQNTDMRT